jgi:hypothetical protein
MNRKRHPPKQITSRLREAEVPLNQATPCADVYRKLGVWGQTYCRRREEYGGMRVAQALRLKELEQE